MLRTPTARLVFIFGIKIVAGIVGVEACGTVLVLLAEDFELEDEAVFNEELTPPLLLEVVVLMEAGAEDTLVELDAEPAFTL